MTAFRRKTRGTVLPVVLGKERPTTPEESWHSSSTICTDGGHNERDDVRVKENGEVERGRWLNSQRHGFFTVTRADGKCIERGFYRRGEREGYFQITWADGSKEESNWLQGTRSGMMKRTTALGDVEESHWVEGKRHGPFSVMSEKGYSIHGTFQDGREHGSFHFLKGNGYEEHTKWTRGEKNGAYTYIQPNCTTEGYYKNGRKDGISTTRFASGDVLTLRWVYGRKHGTFELCQVDSRAKVTKVTGNYMRGQLQIPFRVGYGPNQVAKEALNETLKALLNSPDHHHDGWRSAHHDGTVSCSLRCDDCGTSDRP